MIWESMSSNGVGEIVFIEGSMNDKQYSIASRYNLCNSALKLEISN